MPPDILCYTEKMAPGTVAIVKLGKDVIANDVAISFPNTYEHVANNAAGVYFVEPIIDTKYPGYTNFSAKYKA